MKGFFNWLRNISLTRKLYFVVGIMALLIAVELFTLSFMVHTLSSTRALVGAEGSWSKAEKDAVYSLTKYGYSHDEKDYRRYLTLLEVPLGDRRARLQLIKKHPNIDTIWLGFMQGQLDPNDIKSTIRLLTRFRNISYIKKAISMWTQGDYYIDALQYLGNRLHQQVTNDNTPLEEIAQTQDQIYELDGMLTQVENNFSTTLGEGSRWIESLVIKILFTIAITVEFTGLFLTISVSRAISRGIREVVRVAKRVARADFSRRARVYSGDEIGLLAASFNQMIDDLQKKIAEENKAEEALLNQKNLYETLLKTESEMGEGVAITQEEKLIYVNDAVCNMYGYSREEILKMPSFFSMVPPEEMPYLLERQKQRMDGRGEQSSGETKIIRKDKRIIDIEYTVRNMHVDGRLQTLALIRDVTEEKQKEKLLHQEKERAESAEIARKVGEQFLANMSHEIRTPMNAVIGFTDIMLKTPLTAEQYQYLEAIKISGDNLLVIINDILDFSRMRSGKIPIEEKEFKLSRVVAMCLELMQPRALKKGITLSSSVDENIPDRLLGDATRLNQVLLNLTANAIKFTSQGGVKTSVKLLSEDNNGIELEFMVEDTGIGIPKEKLNSIFEPFIQADNDTARKFGGTGLGLSIVKELAALQGGSVSVSSEEGKGSRFYFRIKYKKNLSSARSRKETTTVSPLANLKKRTVLLAEDNDMNKMLAHKVLSDWGWDIDIVDNGIEALKKLREKDFDIILMDIQMPAMDGYEATRQIRHNFPPPKCNTPIMAMTAHVMPNEEEKCLQVGMNGYISKPFNPQTLYAKIAAIVDK